MTSDRPSTVVSNPTDNDDTCPGCGTTTGVQHQPAPPTVQAWSCTACGMDWAVTVINPTVRTAMHVIGLLPTPALRSAALLAVLRTDVRQRSAKERHPMTDTTVSLPATELFNVDPMASADVVVWACRICDPQATARYRPAARTAAVAHLVDLHRATVSTGQNG